MNDVDSAAPPSVNSATPPARGARLDRLGIVLALLAFVAALAARGVLPGWCLSGAAGVALLASAALPLLARWSPQGADPLKLALFTLALSPFLAALVWSAWHLVFDARDALAATALTFALAHLASLGRSVRIVAWSRAQFSIVGLAVVLALGASLLLLRGNEPRFAGPGILRAAVAMSVDRSLPPLHPWLAGEPWTRAWAADLFAAFSMRALASAPTLVHALFAVFALLLTPLLLFQVAATIWRDSRRSTISVALALFAGCFASRGLKGDRAALDLFLSPGPAAPALMLSLAALACAAHALTHGKRPWVGLCALFHGLALLLDFSSAWPAALATLLAALSPYCDVWARPRVLLGIVLAALPGLVQLRWLEPIEVPIAAESFSIGARLVGLFGPLALAVAGIVLARRAIEPSRRVVLVLCAFAALSGLLAASIDNAWTNQTSAWSLALFFMALPCAVLFEGTGLTFGMRRWPALAACVGFGMVGLLVLGKRVFADWPQAGGNDALLGETACSLEPISNEASAVDLRAALACLREDERLGTDRAVLLACPTHNPYRTTRDLPELGLAACAGISVYGSAGQNLLVNEPQYMPRLEQLLKLFRHPGDFDATLFARMENAGVRAVIALVRDEDRAINPALLGKLERMGFARWHDFGGVSLYIGPRAAALRYLKP